MHQIQLKPLMKKLNYGLMVISLYKLLKKINFYIHYIKKVILNFMTSHPFQFH